MLARLAFAAIVSFGTLPERAAAQQAPAGSSEALEQKLKEALATNEALKERIQKLEEMLKRDVCADPAAAEALLNAKVPTPVP